MLQCEEFTVAVKRITQQLDQMYFLVIRIFLFKIRFSLGVNGFQACV